MGANSNPSPWLILNDYTKTVVTLASAFLAFTGTFSTSDRLAAAPIWPLLTCWCLLILAIATALFSAGKLTGYLMNGGSSYTSLLAANISYFALFLAVLAFMLFAVMAINKRPENAASLKEGTIDIFAANESIPPFVPGSSTQASGNLTEAICNARQTLEVRRSSNAIVIGRTDTRELSQAALARVGSNMGLAQQRAETAAEMLLNHDLCEAAPLTNVVTLIGGPRHTNLRSYKTAVERELALAEDRRVEIRGIQYDEVIPRKKP